jgi:hypothetical protein
MARSLRKELDSLMKAQVEQLPLWHQTMQKRDANIEDGLRLAMNFIGIQRKAILRLAEEIDALAPDD